MYIEGEVPYVGTNNGSNSGFGNGWEGLIGLALVAGLFDGGFGFGGGRGGQGFGGGFYPYGGGFVTNDELQMGFFRNDVSDKLDGINYGLADGFYSTAQQINGLQQTLCQGFSGLNTAIVQQGYETRLGTQSLAHQLSDCCCDLKGAICNLGRDVIDNQNANYRALHDEIVANKLEAKNERIAELTLQLNRADLRSSQAQQNAYLLSELKPCPSPSYIVPNPNCCYGYNVQGVGYNQGCGCNTCC